MTIRRHLETLCSVEPDRRPGSAGNRAATEYVARVLAAAGWAVATPEFDCIDWHGTGGVLEVEDRVFGVAASPYSLGGSGSGRLVVVSSPEELARRSAPGTIVLIVGDLASRPITPKAFPFYSVEEDELVVRILEESRPQAVIAATGVCPELAGAIRPFPLFEDGDFEIPAGHLDEETGGEIARYDGTTATVRIESERWRSTACNVIARRGDQTRRVLVIAHIDTKPGTPGALDNAAGVVTLLRVGALIRPEPPIGVELLAVNGEDYYSAAGEVAYLADQGDRLGDVELAVNIDAAGYREGRTAFSLYGCPAMTKDVVTSAFRERGMIEGPEWFQSDHAVFSMRGIPAVALTSEHMDLVLSELAHTPADDLDMVDVTLIDQAAHAIADLIERLPAGR